VDYNTLVGREVYVPPKSLTYRASPDREAMQRVEKNWENHGL